MSALDALEAQQQARSKHAQFAEPGSGKKRVRFAEDVQAEDEDEEAKNLERQLLFPKGKKGKDRMGVADMDEDEAGPVKVADPRVAALERAKNRHKAALRDDDDDEYAGEAEEDFQGDEEEQEAFEPFNLRDERREGYFDPEGNYVEYKQEREVRDAWLDSVEVDPRLAERAAAQAVEQEDEPSELSTAEVAQIKRRMADALQDGETVLQALRRLGGAPAARPSGGKAGRQWGKGQGEAAPAARATSMTPEDKAAFDRLTEDAMKLLDNAEYNVYSEKKETFEREAAGYEALARARAAALAPTKGPSMFDDDDEEEAPEKINRGGTEGASASSTLPSESSGGVEGKEATPSGQGSWGASGGADESGYVYDEASGYYYNKELGYYYDGSTGLFCSASSGLWYKFDDSTNTYEEVVRHKTTEDGIEPTATVVVPEGTSLPGGATVVAM